MTRAGAKPGSYECRFMYTPPVVHWTSTYTPPNWGGKKKKSVLMRRLFDSGCSNSVGKKNSERPKVVKFV